MDIGIVPRRVPKQIFAGRVFFWTSGTTGHIPFELMQFGVSNNTKGCSFSTVTDGIGHIPTKDVTNNTSASKAAP
jgi:hypothetical protein